MPSRRSFISGSSCGRTHWLTRAIHCSKEKGFEITSSKLVTTASPTVVFIVEDAPADEEAADSEEEEEEEEEESPVRSRRSSRLVASMMGAVKGWQLSPSDAPSVRSARAVSAAVSSSPPVSRMTST